MEQLREQNYVRRMKGRREKIKLDYKKVKEEEEVVVVIVIVVMMGEEKLNTVEV